jgi:hypothetical protein
LFLFTTNGFCQCSNTTNKFYDSLDMPVAQAPGNQKNALVINGHPQLIADGNGVFFKTTNSMA